MPRWSGGRALTSALLVGILVFAAATLVARVLPVSSMVGLVLAVGAPYVAVAAGCGAALALLRRRTILSVVAAALVAIALAIQASWYYLGRQPDVGQYAEIRVLASNIRKGQADAVPFVGLAQRSADVITVAELTPEAIERLGDAGINTAFPHSHLFPAPGAAGIGIWSRYPLSVLSPPPHLRGFLLPAARLQIPGVRFSTIIAGAHVMSPVAGDADTVNDWREDLASAKAYLDHFATDAGPGAVIVGGDFNSTPDVRQFRDLLTNGYRDAVEQTGSGFAPTFPSDAWYPPIITIDHVLTRNASVASVRTIDIAGSDHRALLVTVRVPLDGQ